MRRITNQRGFAIIELTFVLIIVGIIAFVAWRVIQASGDVQNAQNQAAQSTATPTAQVPAVNNSDDLGRLEEQLNSTQVDDSTSSDIDTQTTF